jgi:hypothetical protein
MPTPPLYAYSGAKSQTGKAVTEEFPGVPFVGEKETFDELAELVQKHPIVLALPAWNSHEGEISDSHVIELLLDGKAVLHRLWPKRIEFECITRNAGIAKLKKIVSVRVAATQCSRFIEGQGAEFVQVRSTLVAYEEFKKKPDYDAALCVPGTAEPSFYVSASDVANPVNFTTFALVGNISTRAWKAAGDWDALFPFVEPVRCAYFGVEVSLLTVATTEEQDTMFDELTADSTQTSHLPRIVFATRRGSDRCGLLIESEQLAIPHDILSEDGYSDEIRVLPQLGSAAEKYSVRLYQFLTSRFPVCIAHPFVRHLGTRPCFFACPPIGVLTHGFDAKIVEPVVRRYIAKWFEMVDAGLHCTPEEQLFFDQHRQQYYDRGDQFFDFVDVG